MSSEVFCLTTDDFWLRHVRSKLKMAEKQPESEAAPQERDRRSLLSVSETFHATPDKQLQEVDIFRDTFVRYLGQSSNLLAKRKM